MKKYWLKRIIDFMLYALCFGLAFLAPETGSSLTQPQMFCILYSATTIVVILCGTWVINTKEGYSSGAALGAIVMATLIYALKFGILFLFALIFQITLGVDIFLFVELACFGMWIAGDSTNKEQTTNV